MAVIPIRISMILLCLSVNNSVGQDIDYLRAEKSKFFPVVDRNGNLSCEFSPANAQIGLIRWFFNDSGILERVYQYDHFPRNEQTDGRLLGRATHSIENGRLILQIQGMNRSSDDGMFICHFEGTATLDAEMQSYVATDATRPGFNAGGQIMPSLTLDRGDIYNASAWHECNDPAVVFMWTKLEEGREKHDNITFENETVCAENRMYHATSLIQITVDRDFTLHLTKFHPSFPSGKIDVNVIGSVSLRATTVGTSTPSPTPQIRTTPTPGLRVMRIPDCIEKKDQTAVTVVAVLIILTGTCVIIMSACVCKISQDGEINKEHKSEPKHEVERMNMTVDNNVASQVVEGSTNRTEEDELYESCITCCPCCTCCKWCLRRCSCCKWFPMKCKLCACTCTCRCPCKCPWCLSRLFGITCGSFAIIIAVITLIVIQTRTVCQTYVINSTTTNTPF